MNFPVVHLKGCVISPKHNIINYILSQHKLVLGKVIYEEGVIFNKTIKAIQIGDKLRIGDEVPNYYSTIIIELINIIFDNTKVDKTMKEMSIASLITAFFASKVIDNADIDDIVNNLHESGKYNVTCERGILNIEIGSFTKPVAKPVITEPPMKVVEPKKKLKKQEFEPLTFATLVTTIDEQKAAYAGWYLKRDGAKITMTNDVSYIPITFNTNTCVEHIKQYRKQPASLKHVTNCKYATCSFPHDVEKCNAALREHEEFGDLIDDKQADLYCRLLRINFKKITGLDIYGDYDSLLAVADKIPKKFHMTEEVHKKSLISKKTN